jgi:hypothetical protein
MNPTQHAPYADAVLPDDLATNELSRHHQPDELPALTLARAIAATVAQTMWLRDVNVDRHAEAAMTVYLHLGAAGQRVQPVLRWARDTFELRFEGIGDPLHRSRLDRRRHHLARLVYPDAVDLLADLAADQAAERLAESIVYACVGIAAERAHREPSDLAHLCAACGQWDGASWGEASPLVNYQCGPCRGIPDPVVPAAKPARPAVPRRRRRKPADQLALVVADDLPHETPAVGEPGRRWRPHELLRAIECEAIATVGPGLEEWVHLTDDAVIPVSSKDAELLNQMLAADHIYRCGTKYRRHGDGTRTAVGWWVLMRETTAMLRRWDRLHRPGRD